MENSQRQKLETHPIKFNTTIWIGIDPGISGGVAFITENGKQAESFPMPTSVLDLVELLEDRKKERDCFCVLERVSSQPGNGHRQAFLFGESYGKIQGVLGSLRIPYRLISAMAWQKEFGLVAPKGKKETRSQKKNRSKAEGQRLFPNLKLTLKTADAILLAEWCRRHCSK